MYAFVYVLYLHLPPECQLFESRHFFLFHSQIYLQCQITQSFLVKHVLNKCPQEDPKQFGLGSGSPKASQQNNPICLFPLALGTKTDQWPARRIAPFTVFISSSIPSTYLEGQPLLLVSEHMLPELIEGRDSLQANAPYQSRHSICQRQKGRESGLAAELGSPEQLPSDNQEQEIQPPKGGS